MKHFALQREFMFTTPEQQSSQVNLINAVQILCYNSHKNSVAHGFYDNVEFNFGEKIALIHSELSESLEGHRKGTKPDEHCPDYTNVEIELADACIRIFDLCEHQKIRLGQAIIAKMSYNESRPYKHGKNY